MQSNASGNGRAHRGESRAIRRGCSRQQSPRAGRFLGGLVRPLPDGGAASRTSRARSRGPRRCAEGRHGALPGTCLKVQRSGNPEFRRVLSREPSVSASRSGGCEYDEELACTRSVAPILTIPRYFSNSLRMISSSARCSAVVLRFAIFSRLSASRAIAETNEAGIFLVVCRDCIQDAWRALVFSRYSSREEVLG